MSEYVWWVGHMGTASSRWAFQLLEPELELRDEVYSVVKPIERGETLPLDKRPLKFYLTYDPNSDGTVGFEHEPLLGRNGHRLPAFFSLGYFCISDEAIEIFQKFDLGNAQFYPVEFYEADKTTRIDKPVWTLIPANPKNAFYCARPVNASDPAKAKVVLTQDPPYTGVNAAYDHEDDWAVLNKVALEGPDVWIEPNYRGTFFISDRLATALKEAGVAEDFYLTRAQVI